MVCASGENGGRSGLVSCVTRRRDVASMMNGPKLSGVSVRRLPALLHHLGCNDAACPVPQAETADYQVMQVPELQIAAGFQAT